MPQTPRPPKSANAVAHPRPSPVVPADIRSLLGPSWLIEGEDARLFEELLGRVGAAVVPGDIIDWLLVMDIVGHTWEIQRARRHRQSLMRSGRHQAMVNMLENIYPKEAKDYLSDRGEEIGRLASDWFSGQKKAANEIARMLKDTGMTLDDVVPQTLTAVAEELERIDLQVQRWEDRRDKLLQQIERRRAGWAKAVRQASEDVVDAEFHESAPQVEDENAQEKPRAAE